MNQKCEKSALSCEAIDSITTVNSDHQIASANMQPRPQSNFKKIALAPHDFAGNFCPI